MDINLKPGHGWITLSTLFSSGVVMVCASPWSGIFYLGYNWIRYVIMVLLLLGCLGQIFRVRKMLPFGVAGAWFFVWLVMSIIPDEEYYFFHDMIPPDKWIIVFKLGGLHNEVQHPQIW
ncbi:hypothetical protein AGMMS49960_15640 [Betaproteobacteria bacterium]|nr:hypothetical protein AGMMS49960_15640 [Betaproteobacteria bacterium]GHU21669.1 hypothetical protein AGMMS50243_19820 [Betaproteobacteria bacterium]